MAAEKEIISNKKVNFASYKKVEVTTKNCFSFVLDEEAKRIAKATGQPEELIKELIRRENDIKKWHGIYNSDDGSTTYKFWTIAI